MTGIPASHILDLMSNLVDKSLVVYEEQDGVGHYRLLETVRQYGRDRLLVSGEGEAMRGRHRDFFLALAENGPAQFTGAEEAPWLACLQAEYGNLRAALDWYLQTEGESAGMLRLCAALHHFWSMRGHSPEGMRYVSAALSCPDTSNEPALYARAFNVGGVLAHRLGDHAAAFSYYERCLTLRRALGDTRGVAATQHNIGCVAVDQGDYETAVQYFSKTLATNRDLGLRGKQANNLNSLGIVGMYKGDFERGRIYYQQALTLWQEQGDTRGMAIGESNLAEVALHQGNLAQAHCGYGKILAIQRTTGFKSGIASALQNLSGVLHAQGYWEQELPLLKESLSLFTEEEYRIGQAYALDGFAALAAARQQPERAGRLWGAAYGLRTRIKSVLPPHHARLRESALAVAHEALPPALFAAAWDAGRAMTLDEAVEFALEVPA